MSTGLAHDSSCGSLAETTQRACGFCRCPQSDPAPVTRCTDHPSQGWKPIQQDQPPVR